MKFRRTPRLFRVGAMWGRFDGGGQPAAQPRAMDLVGSLLARRGIRLASDAPFECLFVNLRAGAKSRGVRRARGTGWITCVEPFVGPTPSAQVTSSDLHAVALAVRRAVAAVGRQLTPDDVLTSEQLVAHVDAALAPLPEDDAGLPSFVASVEADAVEAPLRRLAEDDAATIASAKPATTRLRGMRGDASFREISYTLEAQLSAFADVLGGRLVHYGLRAPGYLEIYLRIAPTLCDAARYGADELSWHRHAFAAIDLRAYDGSDADARLLILVEAARSGLARLITVDGLDASTIEVALADVVALGPLRTFARDVPAGWAARRR